MYQKPIAKAPHRAAEAANTDGRGKNDTNMIGFQKTEDTRKALTVNFDRPSDVDDVLNELADPLCALL